MIAAHFAAIALRDWLATWVQERRVWRVGMVVLFVLAAWMDERDERRAARRGEV